MLLSNFWLIIIRVFLQAISKLLDLVAKQIKIIFLKRFLALGKDAEWSIERLEKCLIQATMKLPPEQACWSHARLHSILSVATSLNPPEEMQWNEASANTQINILN